MPPSSKNVKLVNGLQFLNDIKSEIGKRIVGMDGVLEKIVVAILAKGHVLLEGMPGLAKTLLAGSIAECLDLNFKRIQFTPDLMPSDILGTQVYYQQVGEFKVKKGPLFSQVVLADEINRAPAKVQSALLEAMQEKQVTLGDETFSLGTPFFVIATQNPIEQEGTFPLPEAQIDRFMLKILVDYPKRDEELLILQRLEQLEQHGNIRKVVNAQDLNELCDFASKIHVEDSIRRYIVDLAVATRFPDRFGLKKVFLEHGVSPRGTINLLKSSKALAFIRGRDFVLPQDVKEMASSVFRHRMSLSFEAIAENLSPDAILNQILDKVALS
ncbi:MAG: MoxR family ATPase [Planctomycetes bacterium]|nr:MoxR family ATPase [Planctomycetota bacterium]